MRSFVAASFVAAALVAPALVWAESGTAITSTPAGDAYAGGSATASHPRVEFSLDGGKTWSPAPMIKVKRADGTTVLKKADPSLYTTIRFVAAGAPAPHAGDVYTYEIRFK